MRTLWQDLHFGLRSFLSSPGFTLVTVLTLSLGIAFNTAVFSWVNGLLLRPFPGATGGEHLAVMEMVTQGAPNGANQMSFADYKDYRSKMKSLAGLAVHREDVFSLGTAANSQASWGELVSGNYFDVLGVKASLGRVFTPEEDGEKAGAYPVVVISHGLWNRRFHAEPGVIGKALRVNQRELTVVGVAPPEFRGTMPGLAFDLWIPVTMGKELGILGDTALSSRRARNLYAVARLRPGVEVANARAEALTLSRSLAASFPKTNQSVAATILPVWQFHQAAPGLLMRPLRILMVISVLLLFIVCANVTNLLLARSVARRKELSIRLALGAGGWRLSRQLLTEAVLLAGGAALAGILLASWLADALPALVPKINAPIALGFRLDGRVVAFTLLTCGFAALLSAVLPALMWFRSDVSETLKQGGRSGSHGMQSHTTRNLLVISEVSMATLALIGAGLFVRSFQSARSIRRGFDADPVVMARFYESGLGIKGPELRQFCMRLRDRLQSAPGVESVGYADYAPLGASGGPYDEVEVEGYAPARGESMNVNRDRVSPGYFDTMRIPLLQGRDFTISDEPKAVQPKDPKAAPAKDPKPDQAKDPKAIQALIVNQSFVQKYFPQGAVLGRRVKTGGVWGNVIGVVRDSKYFDVTEAPQPHFFVPYVPQTGQTYFFIRTGQMDAVMAGLRREVMMVESRAAAFDVMALSEWTGVTLLPQKTAASLAAGLGLISLILAAIGLYSVMAYAVTQRTQEIGIRMALGARPLDVLGDVLGRGMALTAIGLAAGLGVSFLLTRLVAGMLVNVSATDPVTFAGGAVFLAGVAALASYLPARRATKVDPMIALRSE